MLSICRRVGSLAWSAIQDRIAVARQQASVLVRLLGPWWLLRLLCGQLRLVLRRLLLRLLCMRLLLLPIWLLLRLVVALLLRLRRLLCLRLLLLMLVALLLASKQAPQQGRLPGPGCCKSCQNGS